MGDLSKLVNFLTQTLNFVPALIILSFTGASWSSTKFKVWVRKFTSLLRSCWLELITAFQGTFANAFFKMAGLFLIFLMSLHLFTMFSFFGFLNFKSTRIAKWSDLS